MAYAREYVVMDLSSVFFRTNIIFEELDVSMSWGEKVGRGIFSDVFKGRYILHHFTRTQVCHSENNSLCSTEVNNRCLPPFHLMMRTD